MAIVPATLRSTVSTLGSTSAGPFDVGFRLFDTDGLDVYLNNVRTTAFTVSATFVDGYTDTAQVTLTAAAAAGTVLRIEGALTPQWQADLVGGQINLISAINNAFSRIWSALVEVKRDSERSVRGFDPIDPATTVNASAIAAAAANALAAQASAAAASASAAAAAAAQNTILKPKGQWLTATSYVLGDLVFQLGSQYECISAHTSGTFATDLAFPRWRIFVQQGAAGAGTGDALIASAGADYVAAGQASNFRTQIGIFHATAVVQNTIDMDAFTTGEGIFRLGTGCTNTYGGYAAGDILIQKRTSSTETMQIVFLLTGGIAYRNRLASVWGAWVYIPPPNMIFHVRDEKASGTHGGASVAAYTTRTLNTVKANTIPGASLASNQITLPAGTYEIKAEAPSYSSSRHKTRLWNVTDAATAIIGSSEYSDDNSGNVQSWSRMRGILTLAGTKVLEIRHIVETARGTNGFGVASSFGDVEVYSEILIRKLA